MAFLSIQDPRERPADKTAKRPTSGTRFLPTTAPTSSRYSTCGRRHASPRPVATDRCGAGVTSIFCHSCACANGRTCASSSPASPSAGSRARQPQRKGRTSEAPQCTPGPCPRAGRPAPGAADRLSRRHRCARRSQDVPRCARHAVRDRSAARRCRNALPHWIMAREPRRDASAVCAHGCAGAAFVDRVRRRAPGQAHLWRCGMGRRARHGISRRETVSLVRTRADRAVDASISRLSILQPRIACSSKRRWCGASRRCRLHSSSAMTPSRARIERVEACLRRRDLLASDEPLVRFYMERVPHDVRVDTRAFERWWRRRGAAPAAHARRARRGVPRTTAAVHGPARDILRCSTSTAMRVPLNYNSTRPQSEDGVTLDVPLPLLRALDARRLEWLIPGWLREKVVTAAARPAEGRPTRHRADSRRGGRLIARLPRSARAPCSSTSRTSRPRTAGIAVEPSQVAARALPPWLHFNLRVLDQSGTCLRESRDLQPLREEFRSRSRCRSFRHAVRSGSGSGCALWDFGDLPAAVALRSGGLQLRAYPGLHDDGHRVRLRLYASASSRARRPRRRASRASPHLRCRSNTSMVRAQLAARSRVHAARRRRRASARSCSTTWRIAPWPRRCSAAAT